MDGCWLRRNGFCQRPSQWHTSALRVLAVWGPHTGLWFPRAGSCWRESSCLQIMTANHLVKPDPRNCKRPRELEPQKPDSPQLSSPGNQMPLSRKALDYFIKRKPWRKIWMKLICCLLCRLWESSSRCFLHRRQKDSSKKPILLKTS